MATALKTTTVATTSPPLRRLTEQDAWDIAMAWQTQLQNRVGPGVSRDGPIDSIVESYTWVHMSVPRALSGSEPPHDEATSRREQMSILRAVMISWAALAACPGYSGAQNPSFWKRVLCELRAVIPEKPERPWSPHPGYPESMQRPSMVADAHGFFDQPGHSFPRFVVNVPDPMDDAFRQLLTPDGPDLPLEVHDKLTAILAHLRPYTSNMFRTACTIQPIDIRLSMHAKYAFQAEHVVELSALVASVNGPREGSILRPFRIRQLKLYGQRQDGIATWLYAFLRLGGHGVQAAVTSFRFDRFHIKEAVFQALMSALPFATSVHSLSFDTERWERHGTFESHDLPWIAYAIFHPRAASSSWRHLSLDKLTLTEQTSRVLRAMARGNNLLQLLNGTAPDSDAYYCARLRGGTVIESKPRQSVGSLDVPAQGEVMFTVPPGAGMTVDVCGISSLDSATWGEWVAVVVPAYGLGWVHASELHDVQAHTPATRSLSRLKLRPKFDGGYRDRKEPPESVLHLLRPLGAMISYLDVDAYSSMSAMTLHEILRACPSLKSLVVSHPGDFWTSDNVDGMPPYETALEELDLNVGSSHPDVATPSRAYLTTSLRHLRALRIRVWDTQVDQLQGSREALDQLLRHAPALRYVHWRNKGADYALMRPTAVRIPYVKSLEWTPAALERLGLTNLADQRTLRSLAPSRVAAFLSVVVRKSEEGSCMGSLAEPALLATIFTFAASARFVFIEPNKKDPRRESS